jgi:tetratricopeptide (TPR) repeat protein
MSVLLGLSVGLLAGCKAPAAPRGSSGLASASEQVEAPSEGDDFSKKAVERRAEAHAHYARAAIHDYNEEWQQAAQEYLAAARADPSQEAIVLEAAQRLLQTKRPDQAVDLLKTAGALPSATGSMFALLGRAHELLGHRAEAVKAYQTALEKSPQSIAGYRFLAQAYLQQTNLDSGVKVLERAFEQKDTDAAFLVSLGELYAAFSPLKDREKMRERARESLQRAATLAPTNQLVLLTLADGFALLGESERAAEIYLKLLEERPPLPGVREKLTDLYLRQDDRKKAAQQLEAIIRDHPTNPQPYFLLGTVAFEEKDYPRAIDALQKCLLLNPAFEPAYYDLVAAQLAVNKPHDALATLGRARTRLRQGFAVEFYTAMAYNRMKDYTNALKYLTAAEVIARTTETNRFNHVLLFQLGAVHERTGRLVESENYFRQCLKLSPDFAEALNYLGYMWAERGTNLVEARELIEKALKLEPKNAAFLDSLAWVFFKQGQPDRALPEMLKAIEFNDEPDATLYDHLGDIYWELKEPAKALQAWEKSVSIEPNEKVDEKLKQKRAQPGSP